MNMQQERYLYNTVQQASPAQLLLMLYDGAIRFSKLAIKDIQNKELEQANIHLGKAQDIIRELMITLNMDYPVSEGLYMLYDYFIHLMIEANVKKSEEPIEEVLTYLTDLKETWMQVVKQQMQQPTAR